MDFENKVPEWNAEGTEPPASLKDSGFEGGYRPPAAFFNWFWNGVSKCLTEIREKLSGHADDKENPHGVTKEQLGLENVNNTADTDKYVKFAQESGESRKLQNSMIVRLNGGRTENTDQFTFDGSTGRTVNITPEKIGAMPADTVIKVRDTKSARFVVGTSANGWTADDCDYLCDGESDQEEINAAIAALPIYGGDIILLDGAYFITGKIEVNKIGVTLRGSIGGTILNRNYDGNRLINVTADNCVVRDISVIGNYDTFTSSSNDEIYIDGNYCTVQDAFVSMSAGYGICLAGDYCKAHGNTAEFCYYGINIDGSMCTVTGNTFNNNDHYGINLCGTNNVVTGNIARKNTEANMRIFYGRKCTVVGNDLSVYSGDEGATASIYTSAANNSDNIVTNNNVGVGTVNVQGSNNAVGTVSKFHTTAEIGTSWSGSGPYTQTVSVSGMLASDTPIIDLIASTNPELAEAEIEAWATIYRIDTAADSITVYATEATTQAITIQMLGVR